MAEPPMFQKDWVIQINKMLNGEDLDYPVILRVPTPLLDLKPAAYIPQFVSLGPYHHSAGCKISTAEEYKRKSAAIVYQNLRRRGENFEFIVELMEQMRPDIERFYHWPASTDCEYSQNFTVMMAIDSSFLLHLLFISWFPDSDEDDTLDIMRPFLICSMCDELKLENQIPLFVLRPVFEYVKQAGVFDESIQHFNQAMWERCDDFHPFLVYPGKTEVDDALVENEPHLIGFLHALVSQFLRIETGRTANRSLLQKLKGISVDLLIHLVSKFFPHSTTSIEREFLKALTAEQLHGAGIKFKMFNTFPSNIQFAEDSGTLYLPRIHIAEMETEVFLRNMIALEFNDTTRPNSVTRYIALMNSLVSSTDDVRLLKRHGIIDTRRISDECVANMWSGMCQPFFTADMGYQAIRDPLDEVLEKNYFKTKIERTLLGLFDYVSSWKFIAPLAGFLGLVFTAIETYPVLLKILRHEYVYPSFATF